MDLNYRIFIIKKIIFLFFNEKSIKSFKVLMYSVKAIKLLNQHNSVKLQ